MGGGVCRAEEEESLIAVGFIASKTDGSTVNFGLVARRDNKHIV